MSDDSPQYARCAVCESDHPITTVLQSPEHAVARDEQGEPVYGRRIHHVCSASCRDAFLIEHPDWEVQQELPSLFTISEASGGFVFDKRGSMDLSTFGEGDPFSFMPTDSRTFIPIGNYDEWHTGLPQEKLAEPATIVPIGNRTVPESSFTPPRDWCRHPERWSAYDGDSTEVEVIELFAAFVRAVKPELVLETGTAFGHMAEAIGKALKANGVGRLITLEKDPERARQAEERCAGLPVDVIVADSLSWRPPAPFGMAWLDSAIDVRHFELQHYKPWLTNGAIVGIHDAGPQHPVRGLVSSIVDLDRWFQPMVLRTPRGVIFGEITG